MKIYWGLCFLAICLSSSISRLSAEEPQKEEQQQEQEEAAVWFDINPGIQVDIGQPRYYYNDYDYVEVYWDGPGWYYGFWFDDEPSYYRWRRYHYYRGYRHPYHHRGYRGRDRHHHRHH